MIIYETVLEILFHFPAGRKRIMGAPNAALNVYMSKKERIRDVFEFLY